MTESHNLASSDLGWRVVMNHEEQYSIYREGPELPAGWAETGFRGTKDECLAHIDEVWTDMRPLSLRRKMASWQTDSDRASHSG